MSATGPSGPDHRAAERAHLARHRPRRVHGRRHGQRSRATSRRGPTPTRPSSSFRELDRVEGRRHRGRVRPGRSTSSTSSSSSAPTSTPTSRPMPDRTIDQQRRLQQAGVRRLHRADRRRSSTPRPASSLAINDPELRQGTELADAAARQIEVLSQMASAVIRDVTAVDGNGVDTAAEVTRAATLRVDVHPPGRDACATPPARTPDIAADDVPGRADRRHRRRRRHRDHRGHRRDHGARSAR